MADERILVDVAALRRLRDESDADLRRKILAALSLGVSVTKIAKASGFSREHVTRMRPAK